MKVIDYLYFKLYRVAVNTSMHDIPEFIAPIFLGLLIHINIMSFALLMAKLDIFPFIFYGEHMAALTVVVLIVLAAIFYKGRRRERIIERYSKESRSRRVLGNICVILYAFISCLSFFLIALYKPGYVGYSM